MDKICHDAIASYINTLSSSFRVVPAEKGCLLIMPFMRLDNEYIEIELAAQSDGKILITDSGDTFGYLFINGLLINKSREFKRTIKQIAGRFNVQIENDEIFKLADIASLGESLNNVICAVQDVSYLIYKKMLRSPTSFPDEVEKFLIGSKVSYDPNFTVQGKSYLHTVRLHLNGDRHMLMEPLSATSAHVALVKAERLAFWWTDIKKVEPKYRTVSVIDNVGKRDPFWVGKPFNVLEEYSDHVALWSKKDQLLELVST